jgi:hypothetical protein
MLFQPATIALLLAAGLAVAMFAAAAPFAVQVIRHWDVRSGSGRQLMLERRTYLFSTLVAFVLVVQLAALLLFVFNADRLAAMFVGAMCAVGTLNVNAWGFPALYAQMGVFFLAAMWLALNHADTQARDYPLVRVKYALLLGLLPLLVAAFWIQFQYFANLRANVITSCCGSLFSGETKSLAAEISALPPRTALATFYAALALAAGMSLWHGRRRGRASGGLLAIASVVAFAGAIAGIVSFISLYIYELPTHHCPFCIIMQEYHYIGYLLYILLFGAVVSGIGIGALIPFRQVESLHSMLSGFIGKLALASVVLYAAFTVLVTYEIISSNLVMTYEVAS